MTKRNRKKEHYGSFLNINGEELKINSTEKLGVYPLIIEKFVVELDKMIARYKRVFVLRFDLHLRQYCDDNKQITAFIKAQVQRIKRKYKTKYVGYVWVREVERSKIQHYHCAFFIDGDKIRNSFALNQQIKAKWYKNGHRSVVPKPYYFLDKHNMKEAREEVIYRLSYLAKVRGKGYRSAQAKDYSTSRLP
ncbi:inovirus Gp2 family protein [Candidatus Pseudothioglobus singularis]|nr:inovirus Gp2 family protein [Candidatus Pseudothioglobus singularis]